MSCKDSVKFNVYKNSMKQIKGFGKQTAAVTHSTSHSHVIIKFFIFTFRILFMCPLAAYFLHSADFRLNQSLPL